MILVRKGWAVVNKKFFFHLIKGLFSVFFVSVFLLFSAVDASTTYENINIKVEQDDNYIRRSRLAPQGALADMLYFEVTALNDGVRIHQIRLQNPSFLSIPDVYVYKDSQISGTSQTFDPNTDSEVAHSTNFAYGTLTLTIGEDIASGNTRGYFVVYKIPSTATLGSTTNVKITNFTYTLSGTTKPDCVLNAQSGDVTITGFKVYRAIDVSNLGLGHGFGIPGQESAPMLRLLFKTQGEDLNNNQVTVNITNENANFVTTAGDTNGIVEAYLYKAVNENIESYDPVRAYTDANAYKLIEKVTATGFLSTSKLAFHIPANELNFTSTSINFFVVYKLGESFNVSENTKVSALLDSVEAIGNSSQLPFVKDTDQPEAGAVSIEIGGLTYSDLHSIVPQSGQFGSGTTAPMLMFRLNSWQMPVSLNAIMLENLSEVANRGNYVPFIGNLKTEDGIKQIFLYKDTDKNTIYDSTKDTLISAQNLGGTGLTYNGTTLMPIAGNTNSLVVVTFNQTVAIQSNSSEVFFVVYKFGSGITERTDASGNISTQAVARLSQAVSHTQVPGNNDVVTVNLSGTLPASTYATVSLGAPTIYIKSILDVSPDTVYAGQLHVSMLHVNLFAKTNSISSASIQITNPKQTFDTNNQGVSRILLYRDINYNSAVSPVFNPDEDRLVSATDVLDTVDLATLSEVYFYQSDNPFFVCYDMGFLADQTESKEADCQINKIQATGALFGGDVPSPKQAANCSVQAKRLDVLKAAVENYYPNSSQPTTFNIKVTVKNIHTAPVVLSSVSPRFYKGGVSGADITSEFTINGYGYTLSLPYTLAANESVVFDFYARHTDSVSDGLVLVDGYAKYVVPSGNAVVSRYRSPNRWVAAAADNTSITVQKEDQAPRALPSFVDEDGMYIDVKSGEDIPFKNYDAIPANSELVIPLKNYENIDVSLIQLSVNGYAWKSVEEGVQGYGAFAYSSTDGKVHLQDIGDKDGEIALTILGAHGEAESDTARILFRVNIKIKIYDLLFYPSPYHPDGAAPLELGMNLTQPAEVTVYIFNHLGMKVYEYSGNYDLGYHTIPIDDDSVKASGMYVCKVKAVQTGGNTVMGLTKLAVY